MFLDNIDRIFYGTGDKNENGETFEEFLEKYNPDLYEKPSCTVDMIVIRCDGRLERFDQKKQILLIKRKNHPCIGMWSCPGGFIEIKENIIDAARRELEGDAAVKAGDDAEDAAWFDITLENSGNLYHLELEKEDWHIEADMLEVKEKHSLLPQTRYELIRSSNMDECHCTMIIEALVYLKERL